MRWIWTIFKIMGKASTQKKCFKIQERCGVEAESEKRRLCQAEAEGRALDGRKVVVRGAKKERGSNSGAISLDSLSTIFHTKQKEILSRVSGRE